MEQKKLVLEILSDAIDSKIQYGTGRTVGVQDGYLGFIFEDPGYHDYLPVEIQEKFGTFMDELRIGHVPYQIP
jgi:hypothetical protein